MNNALYLFVGKSGSGKTTIVNKLEKSCGLSQLNSYTTRPKRHKDEIGHVFISDEEFDNLKDIIAYTEYNSYRYCATKEQINNADLYVIDVPGVETLLKTYKTDRDVVIIYLYSDINTRINRMIARGDTNEAIEKRIYNDDQSEWFDDIIEILDEDMKNIHLFNIDATRSQDDVLKEVIDIYEYFKEEC